MNMNKKQYLRKKYHIFYIIKLYDYKKSFFTKKIKFKLLVGFENKKNINFLNIININCNSIYKNNNEFIKYNTNYNYIFCIEKINPFILNIKKIN
jgi:hypothetical protein